MSATPNHIAGMSNTRKRSAQSQKYDQNKMASRQKMLPVMKDFLMRFKDDLPI
jgi:hypothetical protein